mgnify:FL=1
MIKGIGMLLILLSGMGLGFSSVRRMRQRLSELKSMRRMALFLENEIACAHTLLPQALTRTGQKLDGGCAQFVKSLGRHLSCREGHSMEEIFREEAFQYQTQWDLTERDYRLLCQLGSCLGVESRKMQTEQLRLFQKELEIEIESLEKSMPARQKMYQSLGISAGVFLVILLL